MNEQTYTREQIRVAEKLEVSEVMECSTGKFFSAREVIGTDKEKLTRLRAEIGRGLLCDNPVYSCSLCGVPVKLIVPIQIGAHFRHTLEDGRCPAQTRGILSQKDILAIKYNGAKESLAHIAMKDWLIASLRADANFSEIKSEETWKGKDRKVWRKPDVQTVYKNTRVAFEIQLSTTFLDVIVERREFYRQEGGLLFWIFMDFPLEHRFMTLEDVFYNNNLNAFVVSKDTAKQSQELRRFMTDCLWVKPLLADFVIKEEWQQKLVAFDELQLDLENQRAWYFNVEEARRDAAQQLHLQIFKTLKKEIREFCIKAMEASGSYDEYIAKWKKLVELGKQIGLQLPDYENNYNLMRLLLYLFSLEEGKPVGFKYPKLISVAHHVYDNHKPLLWYFGIACKVYERREQLVDEDTKNKWQPRRDEIRERMKVKDPEFKPDRSFDNLVSVLFPQMSSVINKSGSV